jgi:hypothetical protein
VRIVRVGALAAALLLLMGCPFSWNSPLSDPAAARADSRLAGTWKTQDKDSGEWNQLTIFPFDEHQMVGVAPDGSSGKVDAFRLFPTTIGTESFLNLHQLGGDADEGWYFARYEVSGNEMRLKIVDDGLFENRQFAAPADLREFVRQHLSDPLLYSSDPDQQVESIWERVPPPPASPGTKS